ncbi:M48 family metallopeptidase [Phenylobacterium aquaticum]|uniref:M48 family metallopeptidase n=1 Tax=Phenylobacterium aquaticum TaxID=1763816 RepID=UPI001F5C4EB1|nr:SprT family zinc-dependent metalloprotease [Phenylobacterium aquaticum]MCI3132499.1 M48 family metallopeptidase [Phenylobacterium aquaticum]
MSLFGRPLADGDRLEVAGATVRLKVHSRARRVSLRLDRTRREVVATAPSPRRLAEAVAFARDRAEWIAQRLAELPQSQEIAPGVTIQLFGRPCRLERASHPARFIAAEGDQSARIAARGEGEVFARAVIRTIRRQALEIFAERTAFHCARLGARLPSVTIMDAKGRWGSCRPPLPGKPAAIRYSWRLALAPFEVADYVVAHECAHLLELNHGPKFWAHVKALVGDERPHRAWLRAEGARLHAFGG